MYTTTQPQPIPAELFNTIESNPKLRNEVAGAHKHCDRLCNFLYFATASYPDKYIVTPDQIEEAKNVLKRQKQEAVNALANKLVFVGMGMEYPERYPDDVCNHRIRTTFKNAKGRTFFVEFAAGSSLNLYTTFSIDVDMRNKLEAEGSSSQAYYNYGGLQRSDREITYTKQNIIDIVNSTFDCKFTEMEVDNYTLSPDDFICQSL